MMSKIYNSAGQPLRNLGSIQNQGDTTMRMNYQAAAPEAVKAMIGLEAYLARQSRSEDGIDKPLMELVKIRVSQINGCAFCLDMHTKDARALGETEQRIYALSAWRETPFFTDRERAALAWAEANTLLPQGVSQALFDEARQHFSEAQLTNLTLAIATINAWNRFGVSFAPVPGSYQPA
jgi:AhpD family alkylhydroperoxidase